MPKKTYQDGQYYWVRRPKVGGRVEGYSEHPHWQPMLFDAGKFYTQGVSQGWAPADLEAIGEHIPRRAPRRTKKAWMATMLDGSRRLVPIFDVIGSRVECRQMGTAPPVRVEVSWDAADFIEAQKQARRAVK